MSKKNPKRKAGNVIPLRKRAPRLVEADERLLRYLRDNATPGGAPLEVAEARLYLHAERGADLMLSAEQVRALAGEYFSPREGQLNTKAKRAERDRISLTAVAAALQRGYGIGRSQPQNGPEAGCFPAAWQLIKAAGLAERAKLDDSTDPAEALKGRCDTIIRKQRPTRIDRDLFARFLRMPLETPPRCRKRSR